MNHTERFSQAAVLVLIGVLCAYAPTEWHMRHLMPLLVLAGVMIMCRIALETKREIEILEGSARQREIVIIHLEDEIEILKRGIEILKRDDLPVKRFITSVRRNDRELRRDMADPSFTLGPGYYQELLESEFCAQEKFRPGDAIRVFGYRIKTVEEPAT